MWIEAVDENGYLFFVNLTQVERVRRSLTSDDTELMFPDGTLAWPYSKAQGRMLLQRLHDECQQWSECEVHSSRDEDPDIHGY